MIKITNLIVAIVAVLINITSSCGFHNEDPFEIRWKNESITDPLIIELAKKATVEFNNAADTINYHSLVDLVSARSFAFEYDNSSINYQIVFKVGATSAKTNDIKDDIKYSELNVAPNSTQQLVTTMIKRFGPNEDEKYFFIDIDEFKQIPVNGQISEEWKNIPGTDPSIVKVVQTVFKENLNSFNLYPFKRSKKIDRYTFVDIVSAKSLVISRLLLQIKVKVNETILVNNGRNILDIYHEIKSNGVDLNELEITENITQKIVTFNYFTNTRKNTLIVTIKKIDEVSIDEHSINQLDTEPVISGYMGILSFIAPGWIEQSIINPYVLKLAQNATKIFNAQSNFSAYYSLANVVSSGSFIDSEFFHIITFKVAETAVQKSEASIADIKHNELVVAPNGTQKLVTAFIWSKPWEHLEEYSIKLVMPYKKEIEKEWVAESITDQRIVEYAQKAIKDIKKYDINDTPAYQSLVEIVSAKVKFNSKLFYRIQIKTGKTDVKKNEVRHKDLNYDELKASVNGTETLYNVTIGVEWYKEESFYIRNV